MATATMVRAESRKAIAARVERRSNRLVRRAARLKSVGRDHEAKIVFRRAQFAFAHWCELIRSLPTPVLRPMPDQLVCDCNGRWSVQPKLNAPVVSSNPQGWDSV